MSWKDVEYTFNRALRWSFGRKKLIFTTLVLIVCGMIISICRAIGAAASNWMGISLTFLPIFFCSAVLLTLGILLTRIYHHEVKGLPVSFRKTFLASKELMLEVGYLFVPLILAYLVLWTLLGIFYLFKEIPFIGDALGVMLSFGPFLIILSSLVMCLISVAALFYVTPAMALKSMMGLETIQGAIKRIQFNPFSSAVMLLVALVPILTICALMIIAALLTGKRYFEAERALAVGFQWFFIMLPFCALLAPGVIFFFSFAAECHVLTQRQMRDHKSPETAA